MSAIESIDLLTQEEYLAARGLDCPVCKAHGAGTTGNVEFDVPGALFEDNHCPACGAYWVAQYSLVGYSDATPA